MGTTCRSCCSCDTTEQEARSQTLVFGLMPLIGNTLRISWCQIVDTYNVFSDHLHHAKDTQRCKLHWQADW